MMPDGCHPNRAVAGKKCLVLHRLVVILVFLGVCSVGLLIRRNSHYFGSSLEIQGASQVVVVVDADASTTTTSSFSVAELAGCDIGIHATANNLTHQQAESILSLQQQQSCNGMKSGATCALFPGKSFRTFAGEQNFQYWKPATNEAPTLNVNDDDTSKLRSGRSQRDA